MKKFILFSLICTMVVPSCTKESFRQLQEQVPEIKQQAISRVLDPCPQTTGIAWLKIGKHQYQLTVYYLYTGNVGSFTVYIKTASGKTLTRFVIQNVPPAPIDLGGVSHEFYFHPHILGPSLSHQYYFIIEGQDENGPPACSSIEFPF